VLFYKIAVKLLDKYYLQNGSKLNEAYMEDTQYKSLCTKDKFSVEVHLLTLIASDKKAKEND